MRDVVRTDRDGDGPGPCAQGAVGRARRRLASWAREAVCPPAAGAPTPSDARARPLDSPSVPASARWNSTAATTTAGSPSAGRGRARWPGGERRGGVELLEGDACTPDAVARAMSALTFALGRRFVIADGVERWKETDVEPVAEALRELDPDSLTVAFFGREESRHKAPAALRKAVEAAGGQIAEEGTVRPRELHAGSSRARASSSSRSTRRPRGR